MNGLASLCPRSWIRFVLVGVVLVAAPGCPGDDSIAPTVTTNPASEISTDAATLGGTVVDFGKKLERSDRRVHVCFSTNPADLEYTPLQRLYDAGTTAGRCLVGSGMENVQSGRVTGLQPGTTYSFLALLFYSTSGFDGVASDNQSRGNILTFTTDAPVPPTVSTGAVSAITASGATVAGTVSSAGSGSVTERGVCYGTSPSPNRNGSCVAVGSGVGSFTASLTGLTPEARHYVRAFAGWSGGVAYGSDVEFTTLPLVQPGFTLAAETTSQLVERGTTGAPVGLSVTRQGSFTGAVTVAVTGLPSGVTANVESPGTSNAGSVAFDVSAQATAGTFNLQVVGSAAGLSSQSLPFSLIVADAAGLSLDVPDKLDMTSGGSSSATIGIVRTGGWTGDVSLELHGLPAGITGSFNPASTAGNITTLNLAVDASVPAGSSYTIEVRATGSIGVTATANITINVS